MSLKNKLKMGIASLVALVALNTAKSQSIEGYVESSGSYPRPPIVNALVSAQELGEDFTDINGYYHIPPLAVIPPVQLHPQHGRQIRYGIFDILGRKVSDTKNLESVFNNLSSGFYVLRAEEEEGIIQQKIIVNESNIIKGDKKYLFRFNNNVPVLNNVNNNSLKNNRNINSLYEFLVDDDLIEGNIGNYYNYLDTLDIVNNESKDVRLLPNIETNSTYYSTFLDLMDDWEKTIGAPDSSHGFISNYGEYPYSEITPYPQRVWLNPEQVQQYCTNPQLYLNTLPIMFDSVNVKLSRKGLSVPVFEIVQDSTQANIWMNYMYSSGSFFYPMWEGNNLVGGIIYLKNNFPSTVWVYREGLHEATRSQGVDGWSLDPNHIMHVPALALDFAPIEVDALANHILQYNTTYMGNFVLE